MSQTKRSIEGAHFAEAAKAGDKEYILGHGGLHSVDEPGIWEADAQFRILDMDVRSFYPSVIHQHKLVPEHLPKRPFLRAFDNLKKKRLEAKDAGQKALADGLKISINSVFGKTGSAYGWLTDPTALLRCTILGQLTLVSFIDLLQLDGITIISANTDGVTFRVERQIADVVTEVCEEWAKHLGYELEWSEFTKVVRRDINNYIALDTQGKIKAKGDYGYDPRALGKKAVNRVTIDAVQQFFLHDVPIGDTVRANRDINKIIDYFKCNKGYHLESAEGIPFGGIARWYIARDSGCHLDKVAATGKRIQLVERGARIINHLPEHYPDDVDEDHYIHLAEKLVLAITAPETKDITTLARGDWSRAQNALHQTNYDCTDADLDRCAKVELPQEDWAARIHGSGYDTMRKLLIRLWLAYGGRLTRADLLWCAQALDDTDGYFATPTMQRTLHKMVEWIARDVSPFRLPQNIDEQIERAWTWTTEHVEQLKRRKKTLLHADAMGSDYLARKTLERYDRIGDDFKLICGICSVMWKHGHACDSDLIKRIVRDVERYFQE